MVEPVVFRSRVRRWRDGAAGGLTVADIPNELVAVLGGRRQYRVAGTLNGSAPFRASTMLVAGGGFCVGISRVALDAAAIEIGDEVELTLTTLPKA